MPPTLAEKQTLAEKYLCFQLVKILNDAKSNKINSPHVLNIGAGKSLVIEKYLTDNICDFISDRIDICDPAVIHPSVGKSWQCSVESMTQVDSDKYHAAFANYALEHIPDLSKASREIYRVLRPSGKFIASTPNVKAPEFYLARLTPLWFHQLVRRHSHAYETVYAYKSMGELIEIFELAGFHMIEVKYYTHIELYLERWSSFFGKLGKIYDQIIYTLKFNSLMGITCVIFEKT